MHDGTVVYYTVSCTVALIIAASQVHNVYSSENALELGTKTSNCMWTVWIVGDQLFYSLSL